MSQPQMIRVSRERPCPVCGKPDWCLVSPDGRAAICPRTSKGSLRDLGEAGFLHRLDGSSSIERDTWSLPRPYQPKQPFRDWERYTQSCLRDAGAARALLAKTLGVAESALARLQVGFDRTEQCWTVPERDADGKVIGINRRFPDGSKKRTAGSQCGLTYALDWDTGHGPVFLVEGASDTAALMTLGLAVIGRPSNTGGVALLTDLLTDFPRDRGIFVLGERDQKPSGAWPGKEGAERTCKSLCQALDRTIGCAMPPGDAKDVRAWLNAQSPEIPADVLREQFLSEYPVDEFSPPPVLAIKQQDGRECGVEDWRREMCQNRLLSLDYPGLYLDRSPTGAGKSYLDILAVSKLLGRTVG